MKQRILSGIQPSGVLHIGSYLGAIQPWVRHQKEKGFESIFFVADLHAITVPMEPKALHENTRSNTAWYIASGIDPTQSPIYVQSHNKDNANLGWILGCFTSIGQLNRMTQYKDKKSRVDFVSGGLFTYPVLMAADILLYDVNFVPVGEDQKQHMELTQDIAEKFNKRYGNIFVIPKYMPAPSAERVMSLQDPKKKMSKSVNDPMGTIDLIDTPDTIRKKMRSAVTDSGNEVRMSKDKPAISNLVKIYVSLSGKTEKELDTEYSGKGYKKFKDDLAEVIVTHLSPIQEKYNELRESKKLEGILEDGLERVKKISSKKLAEVESVVGLG